MYFPVFSRAKRQEEKNRAEGEREKEFADLHQGGLGSEDGKKETRREGRERQTYRGGERDRQREIN